MTHFALLWKARTIEKYRQNYENEKINSIIKSNADIPDKTLRQRWRHYSQGVQKRLSRSFSKWYPEGTTVSNFFVSLRTDMRLPTILLRSLYGFVGGLLLTYLGFMFFVFQLSLSMTNATVLSSVLGVLLTLGLTFSNRMRCIILLLVPQLFSRVGRYTLTCYALVLILTGPATNTLKNSEILSESMACSQEQIKLSFQQINDSIRKPFNSVNDSLKLTIGAMNVIVRRLKIALIRINRLVLSIASVIQSGFSWLDSVANRCNEALGSPHKRCLISITDNLQDCFKQNWNLEKGKHAKRTFRGDLKTLFDFIGVKDFKRSKDKAPAVDFKGVEDNEDIKDFKKANMNIDNTDFKESKRRKKKNKDKGSLKAENLMRSNIKKKWRWFSDAANIAKLACSPLKSYDKFCIPADFSEETFLATIRKKLKTFTQRLSKLLHVKLNVHHTYTYIGNSSSTNLVQIGIVTEIRNRADPILTWLSWSSCVTSLFLLLIIFRAKHYQLMFETRPRFDNRFITKEFRELDLKRLREGKPTVLPLNVRERAKYVTTTSFRLVASEKFHLNRSAVFMTIATFKLLIHIVADYSLYWVLMTIQHHGKLQSPLQPGTPATGVFISGTGTVARLLQSLIDTLNIQLALPSQDNSCLPNPYPPDFKRYCQIGFLIFLLWFFAIFEPYGLRVRHLIMGHHRPERAKARAEWLYNHILRTRACFMKFARRKLHRQYKYYSTHSKLTFNHWLQTHISICWLRSLLRIKSEEPYCLLCYSTKDTSDPDKELIKCGVPNCPGTYCISCYRDLGQLCTICLSPSDYGDLSDVSLMKEDDDDDDVSDDAGNNRSNPDDNNLSADKSSDPNDGYNTTDSEHDNKSKLLALGETRATNYVIDAPNQKVSYEIQLLRKIYEPSSTKDRNYNENIGINKGLNHNNIDTYKVTTIELLQYSFYEITKNPFHIKKSENITQLAKYLRKKKIIRCKQRDAQKTIKYFMTCSNTNINTITEETTNTEGNPAKDANNLKIANGKTKADLFTSKRNDKIKTKPNKENAPKIGKFKNKKVKKKSRKFQTFATYWKNVKFKILPCTCLMNTKRDLPPIKEKKHKRKKKRKKSKNRNTKVANTCEVIKSFDITENSRLFAYLDDRDWVKNSDVSPKQENIVMEQVPVNVEEKHTRYVDGNVVVNDIVIPRLNLNLSSDSTVFEPHINSVVCQNATYNPSLTTRLDYAKGAIDRFFKSVVDKTNNFLVTSSDEEEPNNENKLDSLCDNTKYTPYPGPNVRSSNSSSFGRLKQNSIKGFRLQRVSSGNFSGYKLSRPMSILKEIYSSLFLKKSSAELIEREKQQEKDIKAKVNKDNKTIIKLKDRIKRGEDKTLQTAAVVIKDFENKEEKTVQTRDDYQDEKEIQTLTLFDTTVDKAVTVLPSMKSCACQENHCCCAGNVAQDCGVQVAKTNRIPKPRNFCDQAILAIKETCTCATQYKFDEDPTCTTETHDNAVKIKKDYFPNDLSTEIPQSSKKTDNITNAVKARRAYSYDSLTETPRFNNADKTTAAVKAGEDYSIDSSIETSSIKSEGSRSDTTICSLANIKYRKDIRNKVKTHTKVVTKANKSTLTDKTRHYNVSTATYDWWSPLVEKKNVLKKEDNQTSYEKRRKNCDIRRDEERVYKNRGMFTGEKMVHFKSKAQLIPNESGHLDLLTPLRYLLDSQKHYNELFASKFNHTQVYPVANSQERDRSQVISRQHSNRGRKAKRLEESYTPRRQITPRWRGLEFVRATELSRRIRGNKPRN